MTTGQRVYAPVILLLLVVMAACAPAAPVATPVTASPSPADRSTAIPTSVSQPATPSPEPAHAPGAALLEAQQALADYVPATGAQPVVTTLLSSITGWLQGGGDPAGLAPALTTTTGAAGVPATVMGTDLTGDGREDVVVRIPVMGLPLLVFVRGSDHGSQGYALPNDLEAIRTDFPLEHTEIERPAVQLVDMTGDAVPEVLFATLSAGASSYTLRPRAYQWHEGDFRLLFAAELVSWAGPSDYALEPDPSGQGSLQFVLTYPHLYSQGFDHKMVSHPAGRQVWRWSADAGRYGLWEQNVDLEHSAGEPVAQAPASDRLRWITNEGEEAFRTGQYEEAVRWYDAVSSQALDGGWNPQEGEPDWRAYATFRRAEALLLQTGSPSGVSAPVRTLQALATGMEGDALGELAKAFLQGYGGGSSPDAAARGVAAMQAVDLYSHFYFERNGAVRFPMDAAGILYPGAGLAAYLNNHPELAGDLSRSRAALLEIGFAVEEVTSLEGGGLSITLRPPDSPYADGEPSSWLLAKDGGVWRASLPGCGSEWPAVGWFTPDCRPGEQSP